MSETLILLTAHARGMLAVQACPLVIDGQYFDCRWLVDGRALELGHEHDVPVKFLSFALVAPLLAVGKEIQMWEGGVFADGVITDICRTPDSQH
ncbi:hypothetical protein K8353_38845 [Burkholderia contaminans]|nr:hypothetical protein [Burkholderia contaminans]